jgi:hypothetical protein
MIYGSITLHLNEAFLRRYFDMVIMRYASARLVYCTQRRLPHILRSSSTQKY